MLDLFVRKKSSIIKSVGFCIKSLFVQSLLLRDTFALRNQCSLISYDLQQILAYIDETKPYIEKAIPQNMF